MIRRFLSAAFLGVLASAGRAGAQDFFVCRGVPQYLPKDPERVVVRSRPEVLRELGTTVERNFLGRSDLAVVKLDLRYEDAESARERLKAVDGVEFAAPLYRGAAGGVFTVVPEAVVWFRPGMTESAREDF